MTSIRVGATNSKGVYKNAVLNIGREIKIGLGYIKDSRLENSILRTLELLESTLIRGETPNRELLERIEKLPTKIKKKLVNQGLVESEEKTLTLTEVMEAFLAEKLQTGDPRSVRNYRNAITNGLLRFIGGSRKITSIDAAELREFINKSAAIARQSTVANQIKRAKALFQYAVDCGHVPNTPFVDKRLRELCQRFTIQLAKERTQSQVENLTVETVNKLMGCKKSLRSEIEDAEWNALVYLLRFGGGRIASYLVLRWEDINFQTGLMRLRMKQTDRAQKFVTGNKKIATVPLFKEIREPLLKLKRLQPEGTTFVLNAIGNLETKPEFETTSDDGSRIRQGRWETNLSTTFKKILKRNGLPIWSQPFHALRAFRIAELAGQVSDLQLTAWMGNSPEVRQRHYSKFHMNNIEHLTGVSGE